MKSSGHHSHSSKDYSKMPDTSSVKYRNHYDEEDNEKVVSSKVSSHHGKNSNSSSSKRKHEESNTNGFSDHDHSSHHGKKDEIENGDFKNFNLPRHLVDKLLARNVTYLYPIQVATLKHIRAGDDVIAQARTGTGKTLAFAIPIVEKLESHKKDGEISRTPKVLVLEPTRELAKQVADDFESISSKLRTCCVYGGVPYEKQESDLNRGVDILAGTAGRILDFIQSGKIDLGKVEHVILDEVDRMLDMGFQETVEDILKYIYSEDRRGKKAQTLFFSATCPPWVKRIAKKYISDDFKFVDLIGDSKLKTAVTVEHLAIQCSYQDRPSTIGSVLQVYSGKHGRAMIFCQTKKDADELACSTEIKQESHVLHGDVPQDKRELVLKKFRDGKYKVLITTDVAARGLDIPEVDLVIVCSPPKDYESYVHRSGRTGRAGRKGVCVCFYKSQEQGALAMLERNTGIKFKRVGAPTGKDIVEASTNDAIRQLD
jgi:superfamily II DNA/RNA helicase